MAAAAAGPDPVAAVAAARDCRPLTVASKLALCAGFATALAWLVGVALCTVMGVAASCVFAPGMTRACLGARCEPSTSEKDAGRRWRRSRLAMTRSLSSGMEHEALPPSLNQQYHFSNSSGTFRPGPRIRHLLHFSQFAQY